MFIANPRHVDIAIKHRRIETNKKLYKGIKRISQTTSQKKKKKHHT